MKTNYFKLMMPFVLLLSMIACTGIRVTTDFDKKINFSNYKTYNFSKEVDKISLNDLNRRRLKDAIARELETKGYKLADSPDLLVSTFIKGKTKYTAIANNMSMGYMYMRPWGSSSTYIDVNKSIEGTLFIDLIDVNEKKLVWEGVAEGLMNPRTDTREEKINSVVQLIFKNYPH